MSGVRQRRDRGNVSFDGPSTHAPWTHTAIVTDLILALDRGESFVASTQAIADSEDVRADASQVDAALTHLAETRDRQAALRVEGVTEGWEVTRR